MFDSSYGPAKNLVDTAKTNIPVLEQHFLDKASKLVELIDKTEASGRTTRLVPPRFRTMETADRIAFIWDMLRTYSPDSTEYMNLTATSRLAVNTIRNYHESLEVGIGVTNFLNEAVKKNEQWFIKRESQRSSQNLQRLVSSAKNELTKEELADMQEGQSI